MINWISVKKQLPPEGVIVLVCTMSDLQSDGSVIKRVSTEYIHKHDGKPDSFSDIFTHWAYINTPSLTDEHKNFLQSEKDAKHLMEMQLAEAAEKERVAKFKEMATQEYQDRLKASFDYQDELDKKAALKRAAKSEIKQ
ncbi:hypothetical protein PP586_gp69 [Pseudoalteromonas phage vB_PspS-H40/1]|uniref:hypothetical protein n=1 Tax=Pseudoalteromonas phage vB_PspS-H40/1 TaxID=1856120 RepID=UPI0007DCD100|nr:hypothetical protein PP586_gp69 [Pseudoalteromonas phage vB_PspS-H40/1]ANI22086.1 hypothetical protein H401_69 [Pseudoalteromonas phage vB_PspS-H40/1]